MKKYRVIVKHKVTLTTTQSNSTVPVYGPVASHELHLPWNLDVWYGLYEEDPYWEDDDE